MVEYGLSPFLWRSIEVKLAMVVEWLPSRTRIRLPEASSRNMCLRDFTIRWYNGVR